MPKRCLEVTVGSTAALKENRASARQDPFAIVRLGDVVHRTDSDPQAGSRPVWNHRFTFLLPEDPAAVETPQELEVEVWDKCEAGDKYIGACTLPLAQVHSRGSMDVVQAVHRKSGKLLGHIRFHLCILVEDPAPGLLYATSPPSLLDALHISAGGQGPAAASNLLVGPGGAAALGGQVAGSGQGAGGGSMRDLLARIQVALQEQHRQQQQQQQAYWPPPPPPARQQPSPPLRQPTRPPSGQRHENATVIPASTASYAFLNHRGQLAAGGGGGGGDGLSHLRALPPPQKQQQQQRAFHVPTQQELLQQMQLDGALPESAPPLPPPPPPLQLSHPLLPDHLQTLTQQRASSPTPPLPRAKALVQPIRPEPVPVGRSRLGQQLQEAAATAAAAAAAAAAEEAGEAGDTWQKPPAEAMPPPGARPPALRPPPLDLAAVPPPSCGGGGGGGGAGPGSPTLSPSSSLFPWPSLPSALSPRLWSPLATPGSTPLSSLLGLSPSSSSPFFRSAFSMRPLPPLAHAFEGGSAGGGGAAPFESSIFSPPASAGPGSSADKGPGAAGGAGGGPSGGGGGYEPMPSPSYFCHLDVPKPLPMESAPGSHKKDHRSAEAPDAATWDHTKQAGGDAPAAQLPGQQHTSAFSAPTPSSGGGAAKAAEAAVRHPLVAEPAEATTGALADVGDGAGPLVHTAPRQLSVLIPGADLAPAGEERWPDGTAERGEPTLPAAGEAGGGPGGELLLSLETPGGSSLQVAVGGGGGGERAAGVSPLKRMGEGKAAGFDFDFVLATPGGPPPGLANEGAVFLASKRPRHDVLS